MALTSFLVYAPVVVALVLAYLKVSPVTILLFVVPTLAFQRLYTLYQRERRLGDDLRTANETLARANLSFAVALVTALEASDAYTAGHSRAVAIYCRDIARAHGPSARGVRSSIPVWTCPRHRQGRAFRRAYLGKAGPLTLDERRQMQEHSVIGERILREVAAYDDIATIVRHHHERIDGGGYPDGVSDDEIPMLSRVIAVADAYNAMTSHRPYREAMPSRGGEAEAGTGRGDPVRHERGRRVRGDPRLRRRELQIRDRRPVQAGSAVTGGRICRYSAGNSSWAPPEVACSRPVAQVLCATLFRACHRRAAHAPSRFRWR